MFKVASNASILNDDPLQGDIDTFLFGGEVTFKCSEVGFPLGEFTAICNNSDYRIECFSTGDIFAIGEFRVKLSIFPAIDIVPRSNQ